MKKNVTIFKKAATCFGHSSEMQNDALMHREGLRAYVYS